MTSYTARENYNRICGLISILEDMHLCTSARCVTNASANMSKWSEEQINDHLYLASIKDIVCFLETLRERTPWKPVADKPGKGYL